MAGTVMKFGPQWIRTLTDGAVPTAASSSNNTPNNNSTSSSSTSSSAASNHHLQHHHNNSSNTFNNNNNLGSSSNGSTNASGAGKYKLAEHRYGREEMLALFESGTEASDDIRRFADLFIEKPRMPMAMTPMSEEEVKQSNRCWNSDAVLRSSGKLAAAAAAAAAAAGGGGGAGQGGMTTVASGHIGSAPIDRDNRQISERGTLTAAEVLSSSPRGPPGSLTRAPLGEQRGILGSLSSRQHPSSIRNLVGRGTNLYMRSQSHDDEGVSGDAAAGNLGGSGAVNSVGSAFEGRFGSASQPRQPNSLRARFENNRTALGSAGLPTTTKPIDIKSGIEVDSSGERRSVFDRLPSKYNAENDKMIRKDVNGRPLQSDWRSREGWSASGQGGVPGPEGVRIPNKSGLPSSSLEERASWRSSRAGAAGSVEDWRSGNQANATPSSSWYVRTGDQRNISSARQPQNQENLNPTFSGKRDTLRRPSVDEKHDDDELGGPGVGVHVMNSSHPLQPRHRRDSLPEWSIGDPLSGDKVGSFDASGAFRESSRDDGMNPNVANHAARLGKQQIHRGELQQREQQHHQAHNQEQQKHEVQTQGPDFDHIERAAEIMVEKWTAEDENERDSSSSHDFLGNSSSNKSNLHSRDQQHDAQQASMLQNNAMNNLLAAAAAANQHRQQQQSHQEQLQHQAGKDQHQLAESATGNQQKLVLLPFNHEDSQQWFYRDTQGVIQGPFSASEMFEWYKAGYFVKELLVRRACDELFYPLGEVIKMWDRIPFAPVPMNLSHPPPITTQTILQFRAVTKQLELAASQSRIPPNAYAELAPQGTVLLHGPMALQQQPQQVHPVLARLLMEQRMKVEEEKQRLMEEVQRQRQKKQMEEDEKQKQEAERERLLKLSQLKQQQLAQQQEEFKQQLQNQQRLQQQQQEELKQQLQNQQRLQQQQQEELKQQLQNQQRIQQQQQQEKQMQQQSKQQQQQQVVQLNTIQQQQQQQIERAKRAAQAQQLHQEQQQQQHRKTAWSTVSKPDREPVSLATLQKLQEEEKERERERQRQQQIQSNQIQQQSQQTLQQQQQQAQQRQLTWANAAQQPKAVAPVKTLAEIQKEEEERLAREKQRKAKIQPVAASASVWNNAASHLSWKNPPSDS